MYHRGEIGLRAMVCDGGDIGSLMNEGSLLSVHVVSWTLGLVSPLFRGLGFIIFLQ